MPFTFSHAAATLVFKPWLKKQQLSYTGLILGTMAPDFEYFLRMKMKGELGHQLIGIFVFNLPVAVVFALLFHTVIKEQLIEYLPKRVKTRFIVYQHENWWVYLKKHLYIVLSSIVIGIMTHILWDAFTHQTGFFVKNFSILNQSINIDGFHIYIYKLLQHSSSFLGLFALLYCIYKMPRYDLKIENSNSSDTIHFWLLMLVLITVFCALWCLLNNELMYSIGHLVVAFIACAFWGVFFSCLIFKIRKLSS